MPTVFLHGFTGDRDSWDEVFAHWPDPSALTQAMEAATAVAIDLPGHGAGPAVSRGWRANLEAMLEECSSRLYGVREGMGELVVVGYSLGARVALGMVAEGLADRAILVSVNPGLDDGERAGRRAADAEWAKLLRERGVAEFAERWAAQPLFASQTSALDEAARQRRKAQRLAQSPELLAQSLEQMGLAEMRDYRPRLPALAEQLTLVVGERDAKFRALAEQMVASAGLPLHVIADCGHDVPLEQPRALGKLLGQLLSPLP
jgi:2-succinyl-6-hydroxy-2,4-cyclohexadiene-1-carboxylate synthase